MSLHERQPKHYQAGKSHHTFSILWKYDHKNLSQSTIKPQNVHLIFLRRGFITFSWHVLLTAVFIINPLCPHIYMSGCLHVYFLPTSHENAARPLPRTLTREWRRNVNFKGKDFFFFNSQTSWMTWTMTGWRHFGFFWWGYFNGYVQTCSSSEAGPWHVDPLLPGPLTAS